MPVDKIAVIILNYRNVEDTLACASSLLFSMEKPWIIVIVDNNSEDNSVQVLRAWGKKQERFAESQASDVKYIVERFDDRHVETTFVLFVRSLENKGYAAGNNLGITAALALGVDACWVLNNDTRVDPWALGAMRERLEAGQQGKRLGLIGSLILYDDNSGSVQCCAGGYTNVWTGLSRLVGQGLSLEQAKQLSPATVDLEINFIYGASVLASTEFIEEVGLMEESFFLYCEEQDWAWRGLTQGFDLAYAPGAIVYHKEGASTGMNCHIRNLKRLMQLARSRLLLAWKHQPLACPTVFLGGVFVLLRILIRKILGNR